MEKNLSYLFVGAGRKGELRKLLLDFKEYGPNGSPLISTLESHLSGINAVSFTPDRKYLVSTSDDNTLKV